MARLVSIAFLILTAYASLALCQDRNTTTTAANDTASGGERVGWVSPRSRRSTWDIIWTCLTVFFICSWKCTHLNIPTVSESEAGWYTCAIPWWPFSKPRKTFCLWLFPEAPLLRKWARKVGFMALIAIAPELVVAVAAKQCAEAWIDVKKVDSPKLTMSHAFFARMGGFVLRFRDPDPVFDQGGDGAKDKTGDECKDEAKPAEDAEKQPDDTGKSPKYMSTEWILTLKNVADLEAKGISFNVKYEDIQDRAKADGFTKLFALVQAGSLVVQSIARKATGLQITELELMTMAFTICALAIYILWWHKPFDAERAIVLDCPGPQAKQREIHAMLDTTTGDDNIFMEHPSGKRPAVKDLYVDILVETLFGVVGLVVADTTATFPDICSSGALYASGAAFSAVHLAAYNWTFPYPVVQTLWRTFCLAALGSSLFPLLVNVILYLLTLLPDGPVEEYWFLAGVLSILGAMLIINVLSRLALIGLTFYCFSSMPVSVYSDLRWTKFLPHFS